MNDLAQHQTVLTFNSQQMEDVPQALFVQPNTEPGQHPETYYISSELWEDMGSPAQITITVVPGDQLTPPPDGGAELLHRDAGTGQFVSEDYAEANPETTVTES